MAGARELARGQQRSPADRVGRVEDASAGRKELGKRLATLDERPARRSEGAAMANEWRQVLRTPAQLLIERSAEIGGNALVDEPACTRQHQRHRRREHEGEPGAQRKPAHAARSR
jgi:hypothetical protein